MSANIFRVVDGSPTGHCCFEAAVVRDARDGEAPIRADQQIIVCECFTRSDAELIAASLNATETSPPDRGVLS